MRYLPSVNDWMIRIAQLEASLNATKHIKKRPGLIQDALRAEMKDLIERVEYHAENSCDLPTRTWRF